MDGNFKFQKLIKRIVFLFLVPVVRPALADPTLLTSDVSLCSGQPTEYLSASERQELEFDSRDLESSGFTVESISPTGAIYLCDPNNQISPQSIAHATSTIALNASIIQNKNIYTRLQTLRRGSRRGVDKKDSQDQKNGGASGDENSLLDNRLSGFINGNATIGDNEKTAQSRGFNFNTQGTTLGMDYRLTDDFYVGTAFGYTGSKSNIYRSSGKVEGDVYSYSLYSTYANPKGFHLDGLVRVGWHEYRGKRDKDIRSDFSGNDYAASLGGGYDLQYKQLTINPFVRYDYVHFTTNGYQESGKPGNSSLFNIARQDVDSMRTALGLELNYALSTNWGVITPVIGAEWQHEYMNDNQLLSATNQATQLTHLSQSASPDRDFMNFNVGFSTVLPHGISGFFMYDTMLANTYTSTHSFNVGVRIEF